MLMWMIIVVISAITVAIGGVLAIAGSQTRQEEEVARQLAQSSRTAA
jgi:hypothetical protein